ncbi:MAG TPA: glycosyltransferase family 4 protein [Gaiellaceae bacterium]|nr:glycosyltransferase family 4 protein [Gaiellaceae bacterium]
MLAYTDTSQLGGADLALSYVLERLDPRFEVAVAGTDAAIVERVAAGRKGASATVVRPPTSGQDFRCLAAHLRTFRALEPDIVHVSLASPWSCQYALAAAGLLRRPVVAVYQLPRPALGRGQRLARRLTSPAVTRHVGVGERTSREVEILLGLARGSVTTIHNGVPDESLDPPERPVPGPIVGSMGRLEPQKGFDVFLRALEDVPAVAAVLVGDGSRRRELNELSSRTGVADRVLWIDWSDERRSYLPWFDVYVLPSRFEGFPLALLEALLAERAVVAADVGSVREAVRDGETGLLVPPDDPAALAKAIARLLEDEDLRRRLGASGRRLVLDTFTADHMTRSFEHLYDEILP